MHLWTRSTGPDRIDWTRSTGPDRRHLDDADRSPSIPESTAHTHAAAARRRSADRAGERRRAGGPSRPGGMAACRDGDHAGGRDPAVRAWLPSRPRGHGHRRRAAGVVRRVVGGLLVSGSWEARHPNVWPPEVVGVSPDGRIELVTQDVEVSSFFRERASRVMLRWRGDEAARRASLGCVRPGDLRTWPSPGQAPSNSAGWTARRP